MDMPNLNKRKKEERPRELGQEKYTTLLVKQYSVIVVASLVVCTQQVRRAIQKRGVIGANNTSQKLTVISVLRPNLPNGDNGEGFTCVMPVGLRLGDRMIATTIDQCLGKGMPIELL